MFVQFRTCRLHTPIGLKLVIILPAHIATASFPYPHVGPSESSLDLIVGATVEHSDKLKYCLSENVKWSIQSCYFALNKKVSLSTYFSVLYIIGISVSKKKKEQKYTLLEQAERMLRDMPFYDLLSKV